MCGFIIHHCTIKRDIKICIKRDTFHGICERKKKRNNNYKHLQLDQIIMIRHNNLGQTTTIEAIDKHVHTNIDTHTQHLLDSKQITCLKKSTTYPNSPISFFLAFLHLSARFGDESTSPLPERRRLPSF